MRPLPDTAQAGLAIVAIAFLVAPLLDVFAKLLTQTVSPGMVGLGRFLVQTVLLAPLIAVTGQWMRPRAGHWAAGALLAVALICFNSALKVMPIANAIAIFFVEPLLLTLLSALILKERIGWRRIVAVTVGLIGAAIVIRPNWAAYGPTAILPLGTALAFACYMVLTKILVVGGRPLALQFWTGIAATAVLVVATAIGHGQGVEVLALSLPGSRELALFLGMGVVAVIAHQMIVLGLARIDASVVAPMQYLEIVSATLFGWWLFGDFPDRLTWLGTGVIIVSGVYVFHRERRVAVPPPRDIPQP